MVERRLVIPVLVDDAIALNRVLLEAHAIIDSMGKVPAELSFTSTVPAAEKLLRASLRRMSRVMAAQAQWWGTVEKREGL